MLILIKFSPLIQTQINNGISLKGMCPLSQVKTSGRKSPNLALSEALFHPLFCLSRSAHCIRLRKAISLGTSNTLLLRRDFRKPISF